jgi:hypothetical protein
MPFVCRYILFQRRNQELRWSLRKAQRVLQLVDAKKKLSPNFPVEKEAKQETSRKNKQKVDGGLFWSEEELGVISDLLAQCPGPSMKV